MKYSGEHLKEIIFPLGGIGSGSIGLCGNGRLMDFEIFNRPNKGSYNGYTHLAVRAINEKGEVNARVLNGDWQKDLIGQYSKTIFRGYGYGPLSETMAGFRHFRNCTFESAFPFAKIALSDPDFPAEILLTAFNPFIPLKADDSSLPAAFFIVSIRNTSEESLQFDTAFSLGNPFESSQNSGGEQEGFSYIHLKNAAVDPEEIGYGDLTLFCSEKGATAQPYWYRGGWQDGIATFWHEFTNGANLHHREYDAPGCRDMASLMGGFKLAPGEERSIRFVLSWNVPNNYNDWHPCKEESGKDVSWKNYYATLFEDSLASGRYSIKEFDRLERDSAQFASALANTTMDEAVVDAISSNLCLLHGSNLFRLEDGTFYGFEGTHEQAGSCEGTCQHVYNYAYALCFLFPELERSIREAELNYSLEEKGNIHFRLSLPLGRREQNKKEKSASRYCLDGQMGTILKIYRDWKLTGDDEWLKSHFEEVCRMLEFAWSEENEWEWDRNRDGALEGRQHHTLDEELFGPSAWLQGFYLGALKATAEMAEHLGFSQKAAEYKEIFEKGKSFTDRELFNGEYYIQKLDLKDRSIVDRYDCADLYWNEEAGEIKYQIGEGCSIDQLCGQWHANIMGLGRLFDEMQTKIALKNLYKNNFFPTMRQFDNPWRVFALNDDAGAVICTYPKGAQKPIIPVPYCEEAMNGFEYQLAGLLMSEGLMDEGLEIVKGIRAKYNGANRNPFSEIECGSNYARSMASFALLPILSGLSFDLPHGRIGFDPKVRKEDFGSLFCLPSGWGEVLIKDQTFTLTMVDGNLQISALSLPFMEEIKEICIDGKNVEFSFDQGVIKFEPCRIEREIRVY